VAGISLRRLKETTLDLPAKQFERVFVDLQGNQLAMYLTMRNELALWVKAQNGQQLLKEADAILARLVRPAQLASNPRLLDASYDENPAKFVALDSLLASHLEQSDRKAIVWTSFVENIAELVKRYPSYCPVMLHGEMTVDTRNKAVRMFRDDPAVRLLVANPAAAREGLTLTEANLAVYVDRTFSLVDYLQSQDRIHRISQSQECRIVLLMAQSTIDEFIDYSLEQKHRLAKFAQQDSDSISTADLALQKPDILRALLGPDDASP
jgi:SNF2 family DNA or RNA helicase